MKKTAILFCVGWLLSASAPIRDETPNSINGAWQIVRAQYGTGPVEEANQSIIKIFTKTRWSASFFNKEKKTFDGAGGGTYTLKGSQYTETIEYFSWDAEAVGQVATFTLTMENGLLHQKGVIQYKGDPGYLINEWYKRLE